jgi:hypothetical protein
MAGWVVAALILLGGAAFIARRNPQTEPPSFQALTFRREGIRSARFAADGKTVVYDSTEDGVKYHIYSVQPGNPERRDLGIDARLLDVSSTGEMALLNASGQLQSAPVGGGAPRTVAGGVSEAAWSPDGKELAIVRTIGGHDRLEYPAGKVLYRSPGFVRDIRTPVRSLDEKVLREYAGAYRWGPNAFVYLQLWNEFSGFGKSSQLVAFDESGEVRTLFPANPDMFFAGPGAAVSTAIESRIEFQRDRTGRITSLIWQRSGSPLRITHRIEIEKHEDVRFPSGDIQLSGTLISPATHGRHAAIILVHGSGPENREYMLPLVRFLIRHGVAVLGYDKRGVGGSTGDWNTASFDDLAGDVVAAFGYLKTRADIDHNRSGTERNDDGEDAAEYCRPDNQPDETGVRVRAHRPRLGRVHSSSRATRRSDGFAARYVPGKAGRSILANYSTAVFLRSCPDIAAAKGAGARIIRRVGQQHHDREKQERLGDDLESR